MKIYEKTSSENQMKREPVVLGTEKKHNATITCLNSWDVCAYVTWSFFFLTKKGRIKPKGFAVSYFLSHF